MSRHSSRHAGSRSMRAVISAVLLTDMFALMNVVALFPSTFAAPALLKDSGVAFRECLRRQFNIQLVQITGQQVGESLRGMEESLGFLR